MKTNSWTTAGQAKDKSSSPAGFKALLQPANFTLGPDATLNTEIHKNSSLLLMKNLNKTETPIF